MVVAANFRVGDIAEQALFDDLLAGLHEMRRTATLGAHLHDTIVFSSRREHRLAFDDVNAGRLLHVHVAASLDSLNHRQRVPMIRRGNKDKIELVFLQQLSVVTICFRTPTRLLPAGHHVGRLGEHCTVGVTQCHHLDGGNLNKPEEVNLAIPPCADECHALGRPAGDVGCSRGDGRVSQTSRAGS